MKNLSWYLLLIISVILIIVSVILIIASATLSTNGQCVETSWTTEKISTSTNGQCVETWNCGIDCGVGTCCISKHEFVFIYSGSRVTITQNFNEGLKPVVCDRGSLHETK